MSKLKKKEQQKNKETKQNKQTNKKKTHNSISSKYFFLLKGRMMITVSNVLWAINKLTIIKKKTQNPRNSTENKYLTECR